MGWDFMKGASFEDIVEEITGEQFSETRKFRTLKKHFTPNDSPLGLGQRVLYAMHESKRGEKTRKFIMVYLLQNDAGYGWGYKAMSESTGPYYYDCPVAWLDELDASTCETTKKWREEVRRRA